MNKKKQKGLINNLNIFLLLLLLSAGIFSCSSTKVADRQEGSFSVKHEEAFSDLYPENPLWQKIQEGFEVLEWKMDSIKVSWHCIKIDLNKPGLKIISLPEESNLGKNFRLKKFARKNNTVIAFNTSPFDIKKTDYPVGITKIDGKIITAPVEKYAALCFYKNNQGFFRACILDSQKEDELEKYDYAYGGFYTILRDEKIYDFKQIKRSRTGCGLNEDGSQLYILVACPLFSLRDHNGLTYPECAEILKYLGCKTAMQFDGGHSSGLCIYNQNAEAPFLQRKVPTAMGFTITSN